jgi:hypothetical protein
VRASVNDEQRQKIVIQRWKARVEPQLIGLVASMDTKTASLDTLVAEIPQLFDMTTWAFSPQTILEEEKRRVETAIKDGDEHALFSIVPGKQLVPLAAQASGLTVPAYRDLIVGALGRVSAFGNLGNEVATIFLAKLPLRTHSSPALRGLVPSVPARGLRSPL